MPIHDLGYRGWPNKYASDLFRFWVIASSGIQVVGRNTWVKRMLLVAWLPTFVLAAILFGYERLLDHREFASAPTDIRETILANISSQLQDGDVVLEALTTKNLEENRHLMWSWLLSAFLRVPQAVMTMLIVGLIAPPLIARDVRTRAYLMYFSKPIGRVEYILGKMIVVGTYLMFITTVPALGCYIFGVALSSNLSMLADTWDLPLRIVFASLIFIIPAVSVALMFSSLTSESRFAAFAWFAFWGLGFIGWNLTYAVMMDEAYQTLSAQRDPEQSFDALEQWIDKAAKSGLINPTQISQLKEAVHPPVPPPPHVHLTEEVHREIEMRRHLYYEMRRQAEELGFVDLEQKQFEADLAAARKKIATHPMSLVSIYDTLVRLQRWVFGLETQWSAIGPSLIVTILVTLFAWCILLRNVTALIRI